MTGRRLFRVVRWAALAVAAPALWACNARSLEKPTLKPDETVVKTFQQSINRNVDLLFMIDNSSSMNKSQDNLRRNFPTFMTALQDAPQGLPNIHVAVVSSDMGAGDGSVPMCAPSGSGDQGIFLAGVSHGTPAYTYSDPSIVPCATTGLAPGATFISNIAGQANYTGNLSDVFSCIAALGDKGCGYEHQFASVLRALGADGREPPTENHGFLRDGAYLAVVMITNEDDCSSAIEPQFFDTTTNWSQGSQLGGSFRCNEFGHLCSMGGGPPMHPNRNAPGNDVNATVAYDMCTSNDTDGYLLSTKDVADRLKALKPPGQVLVAAITGPTQPYVVHWENPSIADTSCGAASCPWPKISHSCMAADSSYADPAVRIAELVNQFGDNGLVMSICDDTFAPSLSQIAKLINQNLTPPCLTQAIADKPGTSDPDCTVVSHTPRDQGPPIDATVPYCGSNGGAAPCWKLRDPQPSETCAGKIVDISADPAVSTDTAQDATINCSLVAS